MKGFIEVTNILLEGKLILINISDISLIEDNVIFLKSLDENFHSGQITPKVRKVKETYEEIKELIKKSQKS